MDRRLNSRVVGYDRSSLLSGHYPCCITGLMKYGSEPVHCSVTQRCRDSKKFCKALMSLEATNLHFRTYSSRGTHMLTVGNDM